MVGAEVMVPLVMEPVVIVIDADPDAVEQTTAVGRPETFAALRQNSAAWTGALARASASQVRIRQHAMSARNPPFSQIPR